MNRATRRTKPTVGAVSAALATVQAQAVSEADEKAREKMAVVLQGYDDRFVKPLRVAVYVLAVAVLLLIVT